MTDCFNVILSDSEESQKTLRQAQSDNMCVQGGSSNAFTLAEILIVLSAIAIITAILLPSARNAMPNSDISKFKKSNHALVSAIHELVSSDKYYAQGDLGLDKNGDRIDNPKYFCNSLSDILSIKEVNCLDTNLGYNSTALANFPDLLTNEINGDKIYDIADCMCKAHTSSNEEIVLNDNTIIYTINPHYHFGSLINGSDKRLFNLCSNEKRYKFVCMDIDGINQGEDPFGYALRADGKIIYGARATAWIKASIQEKGDENLNISSIDSCTSLPTPTVVPEDDSCRVNVSTPSPTPTPEPSCELSANCLECSVDTGLCTMCELGHELVDGKCVFNCSVKAKDASSFLAIINKPDVSLSIR